MITVPQLIWSGVVGALAGAFMALLTTWLNNRAQNRRQEQQLRHDSEQRTRQLQHDIDQRQAQFAHDSEQRRIDREMSLRREVYLEAIGAIGKMQEFISSYAQQDISESDKVAMVQGSTGSLNKIHIVGTNRTIEAFSAAQLAFVRSNRRLGTTRLDIIRKSIDIEQSQRALRRLEERRLALLQLAGDFEPTSRRDAVEEIRSRILAIEDEIEATSSSLDESQNNLFRLQMRLIGESVESNVEMITAFSAAVVVVREELRFGLDVEAYRSFIKAHQDEVRKELTEFLSEASEKARGEDANGGSTHS